MLHFVFIAAAVAIGVALGLTFRRALVSVSGFAALIVCAVATALCSWFAFDGLILHRDHATFWTYIVVAGVGYGFGFASITLWEALVEKPGRRKRDAVMAADTAEVGSAVRKRMTLYITEAFAEIGDPGLSECSRAMQAGVDAALLGDVRGDIKAFGEDAETGAMLARAYLSMAIVTGSLEQPQYLDDIRCVMRKAQTQLRVMAMMGDPDDQFMWDVRFGRMDEARLGEVRAAWRKDPDLMRSLFEHIHVDQPEILAFARR